MTLNITIVTKWGIWQSSDHRLTELGTGYKLQDNSVKHVVFHFPDGGALLAYSGIGSVAGISISSWVREVLRGETRRLDETFVYLREKATHTIGPIVKGKTYHMFSIGAFLQGHPWVIQIRNFEITSPDVFGPPLGKFMTAGFEVKEQSVVFGGGELRSLTQKEWREIATIASNHPHTPNDFHGLLAKYNRKASQHPRYGKTISASCITSFMPPQIAPVNSKYNKSETDQGIEFFLPVLFMGIDLAETSLVDSQLFHTMSQNGQIMEKNEKDNLLDKSSQMSVRPMDRISPYLGKKRNSEESNV